MNKREKKKHAAAAEQKSAEQCSHVWQPFRDTRIIFGITGGIAAFRAADYARRLCKEGAEITPVLTENGARFISPLTLSALTGKDCMMDMFHHQKGEAGIPHIDIPKRAHIFVVLPATANFLARAANGMADDLLTTMLLAFQGPVIIFPSMNPAMYTHPATMNNMKRLAELGYQVVDAESGEVACGDRGPGRLPGFETVHFQLRKAITCQTLKEKRVLVTAGPTREPIDPVRYISNRSSGRMGYAVAAEAAVRGAEVTVVTGPTTLPPPSGVRCIRVETAQEMAEQVLGLQKEMDIIVMAAAVADYTPERQEPSKIKKSGEKISLSLKRTQDILSALGKQVAPGQILVGFCAETENLVENARKKLFAKGIHLIVGNNVLEDGAGFDKDTNKVIILDREENLTELPVLPKEEVADAIWHKVQELISA